MDPSHGSVAWACGDLLQAALLLWLFLSLHGAERCEGGAVDRRQGARLPCPSRKGARSDGQGGQAGQEEASQRPGDEADKVQQAVRQRR